MPTGCSTRRTHSRAAWGSGGLFRYLNGGKDSVAADVSTDAGRAAVRDAIGRADLLVEHLGAGELERLGLNVDVPALVRISDFGQHGPYVGTRTSGLTI